MIYALLADLLATFHLGIVLFVLLGQAAILAGILRGWEWIDRALFRWTHVGLMVFIAAQGALGAICPLTIWEETLRQSPVYEGSFITSWLNRIIYLEDFDPTFVPYLSVGFLVLVVSSFFWKPLKPRDNKGPMSNNSL